MIYVDPFQSQLLKKKICKSFLLKARRLLKAVQGCKKFIHYIIICFGFCAFENLYLEKLVNRVVQKGNFDIYLVYIQVKKGCYYKENSKSYKFYYSCKSLIKINFKLLEIAFDNSSSFETSNISIYIALYFVYPLTSQWSITWFNVIFVFELPGLVFIKLIKFFLHCLNPFGNIGALHCIGIDLKLFNVKLGKAYKLVLISGICQIDSSCQNFQKIFIPWLCLFFSLRGHNLNIFIIFILSP